MRRTNFFTTHAEFYLIDSKADVVPDDFAHLVWSIGVSCNSSYQIAIPPRHLLPIRKIPGTWNVAGIDCIPYDYIKSLFSGSCPKTPAARQFLAFL